MKFRIKKGKHRAWPPRFGIFFKKTVFNRQVVFDNSCRYNIGIDQDDTNKLFGIGYFFNHKIDSARFGWSYYPGTDKILFSAYCYVDGERIIKPIIEVKLGFPYLLKLIILKGQYVFEVEGITVIVNFSHRKRWGFPLNVYFGGNIPAPNDMIIQMKKF